MKNLLKRVSCCVFATLFILTMFSPSYAINETMLDITNIKSTIDDYVHFKYQALANLTLPSDVNMSTNTKQALHIEMEKEELLAQISILKAMPEDLRFLNYKIDTKYGNISVVGNTAQVDISAVCTFRSYSTPEIESQMGSIYRINLEKDKITSDWVIVGRENTTLFDKTFWGENPKSLSTAVTRRQELVQSANRLSTYTAATSLNESIVTPYATLKSYNRSGAINAARAYVAPTSTTWVDGQGYSYSYPSGYSQKTEDCTNYVSFCINYGGGVPQVSGTWAPNTYNWYNVKGLGTYLQSSKSVGPVGTLTYDSPSYPSIAGNYGTIGDVVQFTSAPNDWTHSSIITYVSSSGSVSVCMHDAQNYYSQTALGYFYSDIYSGDPDRRIRFITINGYY